MVQCIYDTVSERDMDLLFLEAISSDKDFAKIFVNRVSSLQGKDFEVVSVELSKAHKDFGESDITVVIEIDGQKIGLLIEDKISAIAMKDQPERYRKRGEYGITRDDYSEYHVFIVCPEKYYKTNNSAKRYEFFVSYEECLSYFETKADIISNIRKQQLTVALYKAKHVSETEINKNANSFLNRYIDYKDAHKEDYLDLELRTSRSANGYWIEFKTPYHDMLIIHKANIGVVDLTFGKAAVKYNELLEVAEWLIKHGMPKVKVEKTTESAALRLEVPKINVAVTPYDEVSDEQIKECLDAVKELNELAIFLEKTRMVATYKYQTEKNK